MFSDKALFSKCDQIPADSVTFNEEIHNGKFYFLYSESQKYIPIVHFEVQEGIPIFLKNPTLVLEYQSVTNFLRKY